MEKSQALMVVLDELHHLENTQKFYLDAMRKIEQNIGTANINPGTQYFTYKANAEQLNFSIATAKRIYNSLEKI